MLLKIVFYIFFLCQLETETLNTVVYIRGVEEAKKLSKADQTALALQQAADIAEEEGFMATAADNNSGEWGGGGGSGGGRKSAHGGGGWDDGEEEEEEEAEEGDGNKVGRRKRRVGRTRLAFAALASPASKVISLPRSGPVAPAGAPGSGGSFAGMSPSDRALIEGLQQEQVTRDKDNAKLIAESVAKAIGGRAAAAVAPEGKTLLQKIKELQDCLAAGVINAKEFSDTRALYLAGK